MCTITGARKSIDFHQAISENDDRRIGFSTLVAFFFFHFFCKTSKEALFILSTLSQLVLPRDAELLFVSDLVV